MKKILFLFLFNVVFVSVHVQAQGTKYTTHTIAQGETLSILAQKYHTTVGDIMRLNGMNPKSQLTVGEKIKIPAVGVKSKNVSVTKTPPKTSADSSFATHFVLHGETLYSISKKFGVTIDQLKQWNNLGDENIHFGQELAVSSEGVAAVAARKTEQQRKEQQEAELQKADTTKTVAKNFVDTAKDKNENTDTTKQLVANAVSVDVVPVNTLPVQDSSANNTGISKNINGGYFAKDFSEGNNLENINGDATTFKTNSGWNDKKYYILMNEVPTGSIVKVSSSSGKSIYAKVLWKMEDMKMNEGLTFRISDAAASALEINESKFPLTVEYYK